jgi:hypothetical protein
VAVTSPQLDPAGVQAGFLPCLLFGACALLLATKITQSRSASS